MIEMIYARHALMTSARPEAAAASLCTLSGTLSCAVLPPVILAAELGFRGWPSASAGPTVMSGASGEGGVRLAGRPPPFEPQVSGENIAAGLLVDSLSMAELTNETQRTRETVGPMEQSLQRNVRGTAGKERAGV